VGAAGHAGKITSVAISSDATQVATGDSDGLVRVWSIDGKIIGGPFAVIRA
jgi:WD40 repeat protein